MTDDKRPDQEVEWPSEDMAWPSEDLAQVGETPLESAEPTAAQPPAEPTAAQPPAAEPPVAQPQAEPQPQQPAEFQQPAYQAPAAADPVQQPAEYQQPAEAPPVQQPAEYQQPAYQAPTEAAPVQPPAYQQSTEYQPPLASNQQPAVDYAQQQGQAYQPPLASYQQTAEQQPGQYEQPAADAAGYQQPGPYGAAQPTEGQPQPGSADYDEQRPPPEPAQGVFEGPAPALAPAAAGPFAVQGQVQGQGQDGAGDDDPPEGTHKRYFRGDIEGLRAVAVIAVLLFHVGVPFMSGGFVGVDVFYVISGFLITALLLREGEETGKVDIIAFYARRMRRLLPAALLVIVVTLALSAAIVSPLRLTEIAGDAAAAAMYLANFRFAIEATNYLAVEAPSPLLHYWSLGVEEQFYLVWPLLLLVATRILSIRFVGVFIAILAVASFALSMYLTSEAQAWAFFSPFTRAWELAAGALIAVGLIRLPSRAPKIVGQLLLVVGLALIIVAVLVIDTVTPFPGLAALLPVLGAMLVIVGGAGGRGPVSRLLLDNPIARYIGRISYSLYLWHWPLLILVPIAIGSDEMGVRLGLAAAAVVIAAISTEVVERPFRRSRYLDSHDGGAFQLGLTGSVAVAAVALLMSGAIDIPNPWYRPDPIVVELAGVRDDMPAGFIDGCHRDFTEKKLSDCAYGDTESERLAILFGDSHAAQWLPALDSYARDRGWRLEVHTKSACSPSPVPIWDRRLKRLYDECIEWRERVMKRITKQAPAAVFVGSSRDYELWDGGTLTHSRDVYPYWQRQMTQLLSDVGEGAGRVVLLGETPRLNFDPVDCLADESTFNCDPAKVLVVDANYAALEELAAGDAKASLLDINDILCPRVSCPVVVDDVVVYRDRHHLTATYMGNLAEPIANLLEGRAPFPTPAPSPVLAVADA